MKKNEMASTAKLPQRPDEAIRPGLFRNDALPRVFPENEIGSRMSSNFIQIPDTATIKQAMSQLIRQAAEHDNISTLYLVDPSGRFQGSIDLKDLIIAREDTPLSSIMTASSPCLSVNAAVEDCLPLFREHPDDPLPVLDEAGRLLGVVPASALLELLGEELGDDYAKLGGLSSEEALSDPVLQSVKARLPWLCILLILGLGVSYAVGLFSAIAAQLPVLLCFQSLILDMAGNVGTQSLAVAIRVLMDPQLEHRHRTALVWKEARIGLVNGGTLAVLSFLAIGTYLWIAGDPPGFAFALSGCLGAALVLSMVVSSLSGTLIPIFFQRIGIDPAVASGPLITTVNDLVAVISYYGLSRLILLELLHLG